MRRDRKLFAYSLDQHITASQAFIRRNVTDLTAATSIDHSSISLCLPGLKSERIFHHSWKEVDDNKKELVVVLDDGRIYVFDLHVNPNPT